MDKDTLEAAVRELRETADWLDVQIKRQEERAAELYRATGGNAAAVAHIADLIASMRAAQIEYRVKAYEVEGAYLLAPGSTQGDA